MVATIQTTHGVSAEQWSSEVFGEYLGQNPFFSFMEDGTNSVIQLKEELTKAPGDAVTVQLRAKLSGAGVTGDTVLKGNEEDLVFYDQKIVVDTLRHAVILRGEMSEKRVAFDLRNQGREALVDWASDRLKSDIIAALTDTSTGRVQERYLYGAADSNWDATHSLAAANVDAANDKLTTDVISRAKRKALLDGSRKVRPYTLKKGNRVDELFVMFAHPYAVRDLLADQSFKDVNVHIPSSFGESVLVHGQRYKGMWDGVMIFECDEMPIEAGVGAAAIDVAHNVLCGAQAVAVAWGKRTNYKEDVDDYGHENGFAIDEIRGVQKLVFNGIDHGVVHVFTAGEAD
jgi:N4-gp56 family major capsid protein